MYGWTQECKRQQELSCEQQDLEKRLAELYSTVDGGADACADLTAPRARTLLLNGEVRAPLLLGGVPAQQLLAGPPADLMSLGQAALADLCSGTQPQQGAIATVPQRAAPLHNTAIGVEPASRTRLHRGLGPTPQEQLAAEKLTPLAFRDITALD